MSSSNGIYFCYDKNDKEIVKKVKKSLIEEYDVFVNEKEDDNDCKKIICKSELFVLFLSKSSMNSREIINEIKIAKEYAINIDKNDVNFINIYKIEKISEQDLPEELLEITNNYKIKNYVDANESLSSSISKIYNRYNFIKEKESNYASTYRIDEEELNRLELQSEVSYWVDGNIYKEVFDEYEKLKILDLGCALGVQLKYRLKNRSNYFVMGIDDKFEIIEKAKNSYEDDTFKYYCMDIIDDDFKQNLIKAMADNNIDKFNIINISMLFSHFSYKSISKVLKDIKDILSENGKIIINEYDDTFSWFSDEENKYLKRLSEIMDIDTDTGTYKIGKKIYSLVVDAGYKKIEFKKIGHPFFGYSKEDMDKLFDVEFDYVVDDIKDKVNKNKGIKYIDALKWLNENFDKTRNEFYKEDFLYNSGYLILVVGK